MSTSRRSAPTRRAAAPARKPDPPSNRNQVLLVITSVLVVCSLIGGVFVGLGGSDIFGDLFSGDDGNDENYIDPNSDVISAQQTIVANDPDNVEQVLLLANLMANSGRLGDAIPHFEHVLDLAPDDVDARVTFAIALMDGGMTADAELQFNRALELDPQNQKAHYYLANLYMALEPPRTEEAITHFQAALAIDPATLIGERSLTQLQALGASTTATASPVASPVASPAP